MSKGLLLTTVVTGGLVVLGGGAVFGALSGDPGPDRAEVVRVVDGDTLDVRYDGTDHRVRLLNVDTPETKDPDKVVECLGPEATAYLEEALQPGDVVRLEFDVELLDRYGRELAGVFEDDVLVNAEIARHGLGVPVVFEPNHKFYDEVAAAFEESKESQVGMFDPGLSCTFASRAEEYAESVADLDDDATTAAQEGADDVVAEGAALLALIDGAEPQTLSAAGFTATELESLRKGVVRDQARAQDVAASIERGIAEAEAKRQAEQAAEAQREAEAAAQAAEEERQRQQQAPPPQSAPQPAPAPQPVPDPEPAPAPAPERPGAGYTGCRAYVGGPYVDDQGRHYTPIDCETRLPLVP